MPQPTPEHLLLQLIRLSRAAFDMRCAEALTHELERLDQSIDARAYGLLTGVVVSYARPFTEAKQNPYGPLDPKWSKFPRRPDLKGHHHLLIGYRNRLLAHNDATDQRRTKILLGWGPLRLAVTEERAGISGAGVGEVRALCLFQEERFRVAFVKVAARLQTELGWPAKGELDGDEELARVRLGHDRATQGDAT